MKPEVKEGIDSAKALAETTSTTLKVTANMLRSAKLLLKVGVDAKDGAELAVKMQIKSFEEAIKALEGLSNIYDNLVEGITDEFQIEEAGSWS